MKVYLLRKDIHVISFNALKQNRTPTHTTLNSISQRDDPSWWPQIRGLGSWPKNLGRNLPEACACDGPARVGSPLVAESGTGRDAIERTARDSRHSRRTRRSHGGIPTGCIAERN